ncbi:MAG: cytochrome b, partial [Methylobacteriaceae bacterium]|nr:cytochrome b [Methylobacteriaceae bacterium]
LILGQLATVLYFLHFLVFLPLLGLFETPRALPASIADDVLAKHPPAGGAATA